MPDLSRIEKLEREDVYIYIDDLAYCGWARSTIGSQNFGVLTKRYDNSLFLRS